MPAIGRVLEPYLPPPPAGSGPPSRWGDRDSLADLFEPRCLRLSDSSDRRVTLPFADVVEAVDYLVASATRMT